MYSFELPSGTELELREMTGAEEELLTNQRLIRSGEAINQVLRNCFVRLGEKTDPDLAEVMNLLSGDRLFALVRLRQISLGDEVELELSCPNSACRMSNFVTINLEDLKVTPYGEEKRLASLREPNISSAMLIRILDIDGKAPSKKSLAEMSMRDRNALRQEMSRVDAGIDTSVETECDGCGTKIRTRLEAEPAFLFPGVRL